VECNFRVGKVNTSGRFPPEFAEWLIRKNVDGTLQIAFASTIFFGTQEIVRRETPKVRIRQEIRGDEQGRFQSKINAKKSNKGCS
jgi:hypothetical protein